MCEIESKHAVATAPRRVRKAEGQKCRAKALLHAANYCPTPSIALSLVTQLVNKILSRGKRSVAERIVYDALDTIKDRTAGEPISTLKRAVDNTKPQLEVKSRRVGGATYQVPVDVKPRRATTLSVRWLVGYSRQRREKTMSERLASELIDASNGLGAAVKRREDMHKMADSNRAFAHYRW